MNEVFVALGANLGNPTAQLEMAFKSICLWANDCQISKFYNTEPVSPIPQPNFVNAVCRFKTDYSPIELLDLLQEIERHIGKIPKKKDEPRIIDLDILFYNNQTINFRDLEIPHPRWKERLFVLIPLADLTETIEIENEKWSIKNLINKLKDPLCEKFL